MSELLRLPTACFWQPYDWERNNLSWRTRILGHVCGVFEWTRCLSSNDLDRNIPRSACSVPLRNSLKTRELDESADSTVSIRRYEMRHLLARNVTANAGSSTDSPIGQSSRGREVAVHRPNRKRPMRG